MNNVTRILALAIMNIATYASADDIPVVPSAVARHELPPIVSGKKLDKKLVDAEVSNSSGPDIKMNYSNIVTVAPGMNQIVPVSIGHPNRIVTPFSSPSVVTKEGEEPEIRGNVIYTSPSTSQAISMFVTEQGDESLAFSLTLIPKEIAPREITLVSESQTSPANASNKKAEKWEKSQPYLQTIEAILKDVALAKIPTGFSNLETPPQNVMLPSCRPNGLKVDFGQQTLVGHNLIVHVGLATNTSTTTVEFDEDSCADWDIAAVAAFPRLIINPGEKTEIYVVQKRTKEDRSKKPRQSLLEPGV